MVPHERSPTFVTVTCSCGRGLRAKAEQVGTEIRCWECHRMVLVPLPPQGQRVARELSTSALTVIKGPGLTSVIAAALAVTALLAIPDYGVWCSAVGLAMGASSYGEIIRRVSRGPVEGPEHGWKGSLLPDSFAKFVLACLLSFGTVIPLWWRGAAPGRSPHLDGIGRAILAITLVVVPLLMMILQVRTDQGEWLGVRRCLRVLAKHPFATFFALAVVPLTLALVEVALTSLFYFPGNLPFFAMDFMPRPLVPDEPVIYGGLAYYHLLDYRLLPESVFYRGHLDGLRQGYTFVAALPASLSMSTRAGLEGEAIGILWPFYIVLRGLLAMAIVTCLLAAFGIQARWLGSIPALDRRKFR